MGKEGAWIPLAEKVPFLFTSIIVVLVGPKEIRFDLHKDYVCSLSDFFSAACNGNFKEAGDGVVRLPEEDPETFAYFVYWLYTSKLRGFFYPAATDPTRESLEAAVQQDLMAEFEHRDLSQRHHLTVPAVSLDKLHKLHRLEFFHYQDAPFKALISLYILADHLQVRGLKDGVVDLLIEVYGYLLKSCDCPSRGIVTLFWDYEFEKRPSWLPVPTSGIDLAWQHLPETSPLRRVLLALFCDNADSNGDFRGLFEGEFTAEAFMMMIKRWEKNEVPTDWSAKGEVCKYHVHDVECSLNRQSTSGHGD